MQAGDPSQGTKPSRKSRAANLDMPWARSAVARTVRGVFLNVVLGPVVQYYGRPRVSGLENLRGLRPPFLLAANHSSHMDTPAILLALPPRLRSRTLVAAAADYFFDQPWKGALVALAVGAIAVERKRPPRESVRLVGRLLKEGWNLVVYPEGGRTPDGRLGEGKRGIAHLAAAAGVPVVPVGVLGTFAAMPAGDHWPRRSQVEIRFGRPLYCDDLTKRPPGTRGLRAATEGIMESIRELTGQDGELQPAPEPVAAGE